MREHTRQYLLAAGCVVRRAWKTDGHTVALTNQATLSPNALGLFLAAARDFYTLLIEGEWDAERQRYVPLYGHTNPMYSDILLRWKREYLRALANRGAPDAAGIRGESWAASSRLPVGFFRRKRDVWNPAVAGEAEIVLVLIVAAILWMSDHAPLRERVILRILLESGARLHEVLGLTAGGYRAGRSQVVGVSALVRNKGSLGRETKPIHFDAETERLLQKYIRTERALCDRSGRTRLESLGAAEPVFLSRRGTELIDSAFRAHWRPLRQRTERRFRRAPVPLPHLHPHLIRHAHATMRMAAILDTHPNAGEQQRAGVEAVQETMGWTSRETAQRYFHAISVAEAREAVQERFVDRLLEHARDLPSAVEQVAAKHGGARRQWSAEGTALDFNAEAAAAVSWLTSLQQDRPS